MHRQTCFKTFGILPLALLNLKGRLQFFFFRRCLVPNSRTGSNSVHLGIPWCLCVCSILCVESVYEIYGAWKRSNRLAMKLYSSVSLFSELMRSFALTSLAFLHFLISHSVSLSLVLSVSVVHSSHVIYLMLAIPTLKIYIFEMKNRAWIVKHFSIHSIALRLRRIIHMTHNTFGFKCGVCATEPTLHISETMSSVRKYKRITSAHEHKKDEETDDEE